MRKFVALSVLAYDGGEYKSYLVAEFCARKGIVQEFSSPETPQQNGKCESFGRGAKDCTRTMLLARNVPHKCLPYLLMYSTLIRNCPPTIHQPEITCLLFMVFG